MTRHVGRLMPLLLFIFVVSACNRDDPTGVSAVSPRVESSPDVLRDAVAFFTRQFSPIDGGLAVMNSDGSGRRPLPGGERGFEPSISPDGRRIVFSRGTNPGTSDLFIINADGSGTTPLVQGLLFNGEPTWSPDGCQIAFRRQHQGDERFRGPYGLISIINADGTGLRELTPPLGPDDFLFDEGASFSPDGRRLVFTRNLLLHVINVDGTGMTALPNEDMALNPAWSPDGQRIAYASLDPPGDIHVRNADGSNLVALTTTPEWESWPRWSPDGRQLVISRVGGQHIEVVKINADGSGVVGLTPAGLDDFMPDWGRRSTTTSHCSPGVSLEIAPALLTIGLTKTRQLAATARTTNGNIIDQPAIQWSSSNEAVAVVNHTGVVTAVGLGQAQIRAAFAGQVAVAQVTIVGLVLRDAIVYETEEFGAGVSELSIIRPDGSGQTRLTTDGRIYLDPDVSLDGRQIAFSGWTARFGIGIFVMNADGSGLTSVVDRSFDSKPSWSPDGTRIAFLSNNDGPFGPVPRVFVVNVDGTGLRQLSPEDPDQNFWFFDDSPSWSQDGSQVLFIRAGMLQVINADGTGMTALPTEEVVQSAEWSPDGTRIATTNNFDQIVIRNADGSNPVPITQFPLVQQKSLRWSPDSRTLVFCRLVDGAFRLFTINVDGTDEKQLATTPNILDCQASWSPVP